MGFATREDVSPSNDAARSRAATWLSLLTGDQVFDCCSGPADSLEGDGQSPFSFHVSDSPRELQRGAQSEKSENMRVRLIPKGRFVQHRFEHTRKRGSVPNF